MRGRQIQTLLMAFMALALFVGGYALAQSEYAPIQLFGPESQTPGSAEQAFQPFWETWRHIHDEYFDQPLDDVLLAEGAISGMLATLGDPNTRYLSPVEEQAARQTLQGNIEGIGAEVTVENEAIIIVAPYEGSPAQTAGLRQGDILREADGVLLSGMDVTEAAALVRGPAGTTVHLVVERNGELLEIDVVRDVIRIPSVRGEMLEEGLAYVRLSRFGNNTAQDLANVLDDLSTFDPSGLILDLRNNPGGNLTTAVDVADQFLDSGPILIERFGNGSETLYKANGGGAAQDVPLVVLIDKGSASASEVLAGAIRDRSRGILVGDTSFGKGTVQTWKRLSNGGGLRVTVARWLTPEGIWVHGQGLDPDLAVLIPDSDAEAFSDLQLQAAIDFLLDQPIGENLTNSGG